MKRSKSILLAALVLAGYLAFTCSTLYAVAFFNYSEEFVSDPAKAAEWRPAFINDTKGDIEYVNTKNIASIFRSKDYVGLSYGIESDFFKSDSDFASNNSLAVGAVKNAFSTWDNASAKLRFFNPSGYAPIKGDPSHVMSGLNIDIFSEPSTAKDPISGLNLFGTNTLAVTNVYFFNADKALATINIYFNEAYNWAVNGAAGQYDIESVVLHELGHALGLSHPDEADDFGRNWDADLLYDTGTASAAAASGSEIMNSTIAAGMLKRTLTMDEKYGLAYLFNETIGSDSTAILSSSHGFRAEGGEVPEPSTLLLLLPLMGFWLIRRKRFNA